MRPSPGMAKKHELFLLAMLLLMMVSPGSCGRVAANNSSSSGLVSDGDGEVQQPAFIVFEEWASSYSCNQTYGFMPCTATVPGNILLILVYVSLMLFAAKLLYDGSEILVELLSPGIAGAVFLPLLSSLLDAIINIGNLEEFMALPLPRMTKMRIGQGKGVTETTSRLCGNGETAQNQVSAGLGLLTGSTAILLTLLGGCCIIVDKCDPENSREKASEETARGFSLAGSAVSTDIRASYTARIMVISVMPFIIVQLAQVLHTSSQICFAIFISLIISVSLLLAYCLHQVFHPSILRRKLAYAKQMHMTSRIVKQLKYSPLGRLLTTNGEPDMEVIRMLFKMIDGNSDQLLSTSEIRALITGIQIKDKDSDIDDTVGDIMRDVHACGDAKINIEAFTKGISKWLNKAKNSAVCSSYNHMKTRLVVDHFNLVSNKEHEQLGIQSDEVVKIESPKWSACKAVVMLLLGSLIAATFAGPLVNAVGKFSTATNIPSFFVSFLVLPFASFSEAVSAQNFASQKKLRIASLTFSKLQQACIFLFPFHSPCLKKVWLAPNSILLLPATSSNYPSYKPQFDCLLVGYDLLGILNGTHSCLPDQFTDQDGHPW
ncbi:Sodium/calcium exchanger NCL [Vitis vinifera]|uniref:Sodium/calcium exchanger NCL n=1 Tax=Vitis vinifera TaxID=29760 RepID=A0A438JK63_VITVI|nr:Sodium/calcium exchanger NCL [Vitis vinifera]